MATAWHDERPRALVFDNCEDEALLEHWRPRTGASRVLVTNRQAEWRAELGVHCVSIGTLERKQSIELLRNHRDDLAEDNSDLNTIAETLGDLPLALHLAGRYLRTYRRAPFGQPAGYLAQLTRADLLAHRSLAGTGGTPTGHDADIGRTFGLSYERLDPEDPVDDLARDLLARVYVPAVKDPVEEQEESKTSALGKLLQRTVRSQVDFKNPLQTLRQEVGKQYQALLEAQEDVLRDVSGRIEDALRTWAHPDARLELNWHYDENKSVSLPEPMARARVGEGDFLGELLRSSHGMQRSFLVALLQVLATTHAADKPTLVLCIEEPELYQHPPQARHLSAVLQDLARDSAQILISTHSPYFMSSSGFENIRLVRAQADGAASSVSQVSYQKIGAMLGEATSAEPHSPSRVMAAVEQIMQPFQNELYFAKFQFLSRALRMLLFLHLICISVGDGQSSAGAVVIS